MKWHLTWAVLLYQTQLIIVPFTNPLIRLQSLSHPGALLGKQTRRQSGSLTPSNSQSNWKHFQSDLSLTPPPATDKTQIYLHCKKYPSVSFSFSVLVLNITWKCVFMLRFKMSHPLLTTEQNPTKTVVMSGPNNKLLNWATAKKTKVVCGCVCVSFDGHGRRGAHRAWGGETPLGGEKSCRSLSAQIRLTL